MSKFYVGRDVTGFENTGVRLPVSRVTLLPDDNNALTAGDDTGSTIEASCPYATQEMVEALLKRFKGHEYQSFTADAAEIDPAAELGDGVTVGGIYSVISRKEDDGSGYPDLAAPGSYEGEEDFSNQGPMEQKFNHRISETRSLITKTADKIQLEVKKELEDLSASFALSLDGIATRVSDAEGNISTLEQRANSISMSVSSANGSTTFELKDTSGTLSTETLELNVKAANIIGTLTIGQLPDTVAETSAIPTKVSDLDNDSGYQTESGVTTIVNGTITTDYVEALGISVDAAKVSGVLSASVISLSGLLSTGYGYVGGADVSGNSRTVICDTSLNNYCAASTGGASISAVADASKLTSHQIWVKAYTDANNPGGCYSSSVISVSSDRRLKHGIDYDMTPFETVFRDLKPCAYLLNGDETERLHWGFIAQDMQETLKSAGLTGAVVNFDGAYYSIGYTELIALNTHMIQSLMARVDELERR